MTSKEEILKIQTCVLKVNIHCDGCKQKVKKILQKIDGVFTIKIDSDQGKVTVSGTAHPSVIIKKLTKSGKHAEIWDSNNQKNPNHDKGQKEGGGSGGGVGGLNPQQLKSLQDLKLLPPQFKNMGQNQPQMKAAAAPAGKKFSFPEDDDDDDDDFSDDDEFDDEDEYYDDEDDFSGEEDEFSDDDDDVKSSSKMKPMTGNSMEGGGGNNKMMMMMMKTADGGGKIANSDGKSKNRNNFQDNQKGGFDGQNGDKKLGSAGGGGLPQMMNKGQNGHMGGITNVNMSGSIPIGQPAATSGHVPNYFPGRVGPPDSSYLQQQQLAAMMNQRAAMAGGPGSDPRFQHMMYARPEAPVNYMPAYPYPYPYPNPHPTQPDTYTNMFSDENTASSCSVM